MLRVSIHRVGGQPDGIGDEELCSVYLDESLIDAARVASAIHSGLGMELRMPEPAPRVPLASSALSDADLAHLLDEHH